MATLMRPVSEPIPNHPADDSADHLVVSPPDVEAPDAGEFDVEAPETMISRQSEAPDAGEGRAALLEHEFTQGRSRS